jgi:hypothetical protein
MQQYFTDKISSADLAKAIQDAWKAKQRLGVEKQRNFAEPLLSQTGSK